MKIALVVDNPYRDLPGLVLLARELASRGATCFLVPYNLREQEIWALAPDFALLNFVRTANESWIDQLVRCGITVGILDTEGSIFSPIPADALEDLDTAEHIRDKKSHTIIDYLVTIARNADVRRKVACYLAWSKDVGDFLVQNELFTPDQIKVTGAPRTDLLTPSYRSASKEMSGYADGYSSPVVLINASFPMANPAFMTPEQEVEQMVKTFRYRREYVEGFVRAQTIGLRGITRLANDLAHTFPEATFIVRPHPFEGMAAYRFTLDELPNLLLRKQGTVEGWILRASCLIQLGSSTAVEAAVLGVPSLTPTWLPLNAPVPVSTLASEAVGSPDELKAKLREIFSGHYQPTESKRGDIAQAIRSAYGEIDGQASERAADVILETILRHPINASQIYSRARQQAYTFKLKGPRWRRWLHARSSQLLGRGVHWSWPKFKNLQQANLPWDKSEKRFGPEQIQSMIQALDRVKPPLKEGLVVEKADSYYHSGYREGRAVVVRPRG